MKRVFAFLLAAAAMTLGLTACANVQTEAATCAYVIQNGYFDARHIHRIAYPGERVNHNNVTVREVPCNARNYIITDNQTGDIHTPLGAKTAAAGQTPGTPVDVQLTTLFTVNESRQALLDFLPFCEKYNCFNEGGQNGQSGTQNYGSPGWTDMLKENMLKALQRATQTAILQFPPSIWNDQSQWPKVADAVMAALPPQLHTMTGSQTDFFCASGAHWTGEQGHSKFVCPPVTVAIDHIDPPASVRAIYDQEVQQAQQQALAREQAKTNAAQLNAAKAKYGSYADYFLGLQDTIDHCNAKTSCSVILGSNGQTSVPVAR